MPPPPSTAATGSLLSDNQNLHLPLHGHNSDTVPSSYLPEMCVYLPLLLLHIEHPKYSSYRKSEDILVKGGHFGWDTQLHRTIVEFLGEVRTGFGQGCG